MMTRLYADENFPFNLITELRNFGYDLLTSYEAEQANQSISDRGVLNFAHSRGRAVITLNREDFISLHRQGIEHSDIIVCKEDRDVLGQSKTLHEFFENDNRSLKNRLIRVKKQNQKRFSPQIFVAQEY